MPEGQNQNPLGVGLDVALGLIRACQAKAGRNARRFLDHLEAHVFDPELEVKATLDEFGIGESTINWEFRALTGGFTPGAFVHHCRMSAAEVLLKQTVLMVGAIGNLVGYDRPHSFGRAFRRWTGGKSPSWVRANPDKPARSPETARRRRDDDKAAARRRVIEAVDGLQTEFAPQPADLLSEAAPETVDPEDYMRYRAEVAWQRIADLPEDVQRYHLRKRVKFKSTALFRLLLEESRAEGRKDRKRGLLIAELAVISLRTSREYLGDRVYELLARGWAWVGNARRLAADFKGAAKAFELAEAGWKAARESRDPLIGAEILQNKAALRMYQRRFDEALELEGRALKVFRTFADPALLAQNLMLRAEIHGYACNFQPAIEDLEAVLELLGDQDDSRLTLTAHHNLASYYMFAGELERAAGMLPRVKQLCIRFGTELFRLQGQWLEAMVVRGDRSRSKMLLQDARAGLLVINEVENAAWVSLFLAEHHAEEGRVADVLPLIQETIEVFEGLQIRREAIAALETLLSVLESNSAWASAVRDANVYLRQFRVDLTISGSRRGSA